MWIHGLILSDENSWEYEAVRELAREYDITVDEACRQALRDWLDRHQPPNPADPAFVVLDELDETTGTETDARHCGRFG